MFAGSKLDCIEKPTNVHISVVASAQRIAIPMDGHRDVWRIGADQPRRASANPLARW